MQMSWGRGMLGEFEEQQGGECGRSGVKEGRAVGEATGEETQPIVRVSSIVPRKCDALTGF